MCLLLSDHQILRFLMVFVLFIITICFLFVILCQCEWMSCVYMSTEDRIGHWIPWSQSNKQLWAAWRLGAAGNWIHILERADGTINHWESLPHCFPLVYSQEVVKGLVIFSLNLCPVSLFWLPFSRTSTTQCFIWIESLLKVANSFAFGNTEWTLFSKCLSVLNS